jgi:AraC-like DNA-binding protein/quercetin dioxygenase-like cupin family protein
MSLDGQKPKTHTSEVAHLEDLPQIVVAHRRDLASGEIILPHSHRKAQLVHASQGVMTVTTEDGAYVVPPERALWVPAGVEHRIDARGAVAMRTLYIDASALTGLPERVCVLQVAGLLRELIMTAMEMPQVFSSDGPENRLMRVILDQLRMQPLAPLALPMPRDRRLRKVTGSLLRDPADPRGLDAWARMAGASGRTLARLFRAETGMNFTTWRQQLRLLRGLERLAAGDAVTTVAIDMGYDSPSAFIAMFRRALGVSPTRYFGPPSS